MKLTTTQIILIIVGILLLLWIIGWLVSRNRSSAPNIQNIQNFSVENPDSEKKSTFYYFYHPSCGYCKQFMPTWEKLLEHYQNAVGNKLRTIDVTKPENEHLTFYFDVKQYPTFILTGSDANNSKTNRRSENDITYNGNRTFEDIKKFIDSN